MLKGETQPPVPPTAAGAAMAAVSVVDSAGHAPGIASLRTARISVVEKAPLRIVITDAPTNLNVEQHVRELQQFHVRHVVRACEPTYETAPLSEAGIEVHDLQFRDGAPPSDEVRLQWLRLVERCFVNKELHEDERISVHCVAGLGRAPVLVAIALIEFCGMEPVDAVEFIRERRRGAINMKQFSYLDSYKPTMRQSKGCGKGACAIL